LNTNQTCFNCFSGTDGVDPCPNCGFENGSLELKQHLLAPGTILHGGYLVGKPLGQGGFGITYLGYDLNTRQRIAIKEYFPSGIAVRQDGLVQPASDENLAIFRKGVETFNKEARILSQLGNQPNIVDILSFFFENGTGYFVMEFVEGQSLKDYLVSRGGKLSFQETVSLMLPVMRALGAVHREGMLHRDIAPDNIYVTNDGQTKLMDFGAARYHVFQETQSVRTIVKPGYAPMEQYASQADQGPWTDVYAMGATIYKVLTGIVPPDAPSRYLRDEMKSPLQLGVLLPKNADYAIMRAMAPQIMFRYRTMDDFSRALMLPDSITAYAAPAMTGQEKAETSRGASAGAVPAAAEGETRMLDASDLISTGEEPDDVPSWIFILLILVLAGLIFWLISSILANSDLVRGFLPFLPYYAA